MCECVFEREREREREKERERRDGTHLTTSFVQFNVAVRVR